MILNVIQTGSKGNAYLLKNDNEALLIESGGDFKNIQKSIDFDFSKLSGCLVTHEHQDHAKNVQKLQDKAVNVYSSAGTFEALKTTSDHRSFILKALTTYKIGNFVVLPFDVKHDANEPFGFIIQHKEIGNLVFLTDSYYSEYRFENIDHFIIEANYSLKFMSDSIKNEKRFLRDRIINSHLSIENSIDIVKHSIKESNKLKSVVLVHLSDSNSNEVYFKEEMKKATGRPVYVAKDNQIINLNY